MKEVCKKVFLIFVASEVEVVNCTEGSVVTLTCKNATIQHFCGWYNATIIIDLNYDNGSDQINVTHHDRVHPWHIDAFCHDRLLLNCRCSNNISTNISAGSWELRRVNSTNDAATTLQNNSTDVTTPQRIKEPATPQSTEELPAINGAITQTVTNVYWTTIFTCVAPHFLCTCTHVS